MKILNILETIISEVKSLFFNGLLTILPLAATAFFINFTYNFLSSWLKPLKDIEPKFLQIIPGAEIIIFIIFIMLVGALIKFFIITPIIHRIEKIIAKIPLLRTIYSSSKTLANFFNVPNPASVSKRVVLIQYPRKDSYNIAFLLDTAENDFQKVLPQQQSSGKKYYKIFMPNSPNPTSGYFFILPEDELIPTNITFEDAIKAVVSCGLITPEAMKSK
ncbi:DUF502 domain-containing protein [Candidatus Dependentiae bacterium]